MYLWEIHIIRDIKGSNSGRRKLRPSGNMDQHKAVINLRMVAMWMKRVKLELDCENLDGKLYSLAILSQHGKRFLSQFYNFLRCTLWHSQEHLF